MPQQGYWEPTIQVGESRLYQLGVIVTKVHADSTPPVVLGMNILRNCYNEMLEALSRSLPTASHYAQKTIQRTICVLCAQQRFINTKDEICQARIRDARPVFLQPNTETLLWCRARPGIQGQDYQALVEPILLEEHLLVMATRSLVTVSQRKVPICLLNLSDTKVELKKYYPVAQLSQVTFQDIVDNSVVTAMQSMQQQRTQRETTAIPWWEEIHIGDVTTPAAQIAGVLAIAQEHHHAFSKHPQDFGKACDIKHVNPPTKERYRPIPPAMYQPVKKMIKEMKDAKVIRDSHSTWAAPLVLVKKKDGNIRFCVDYRKINNITHKDAYPLPRIEESLTALGSAAYFSNLNLTSGYWQVPMAEEDREKTAFTTPMGLFEFNCMPFGLCNAPGTFQRLMERCLGHKNF